MRSTLQPEMRERECTYNSEIDVFWRIMRELDHIKFGQVATAFVAPLSAVDTVVTDSDIATEIVQELTEVGIHVIIAAESKSSDTGKVQ